MRWLLLKDLLILRRSRLLLAMLIVYPVALALLIGLAISRSPSRPRVAVVDETPPGQTVQVGSERVQVSQYAQQLFSQVVTVREPSRARAVQQVQQGRVLAAVVIPRDLAARLSSSIAPARLEVIYNGDALEQSLVRSTLNSALAQANLGFSEQIQQAAAKAIDLLLAGGNVEILGAPPNLIGLSQIPPALHEILARQPPGPERRQLERISSFAGFAAQNLSLSKTVLQTVSQPIQVKSTLLHGRRTPLNTFAVVVAVSVSLMFIGVLLAAGGVALEREERVLVRLVRGLVTRERLLVEKALLSAACSFVVAFAMLAGVSAFVALGVAIGALAREVRAASLLAFLLSLPLAFLALVPAGSVAVGIYDAIGVVSFAFPFKASLEALDAAVNGASPSIGSPLVHLAGLMVLFAALARVGLRRVD